MTKIYTRVVLGPDLTVLEADFFDYQGPMVTCTGAEPLLAEPALEAGGKAAADAVGGEALGSALPEFAAGSAVDTLPAFAEFAPEALGGGTLAADSLGATALGNGIATSLPEFAAGSAADTLPAVSELSPGLTTAEASALPSVGSGAAEITGTVDPSLVTEPPGTPAPASSTPYSTELIKEPPGTPGTAGPLGSIGDKLLSSITNNPLTAAALGLNAASAISQRGAAGQAAGQLRDIAKPFSQEGESLLAQYHAGKLNPADEFNINKWEHEAIAQARGALGKQGGTALMSKIAAIQQQAQTMREQALRGLLGEGLKASGMAVGPLSAAVTAQANQDHGFMQAQSGALNSLLTLQALQGRGAPIG